MHVKVRNEKGETSIPTENMGPYFGLSLQLHPFFVYASTKTPDAGTTAFFRGIFPASTHSRATNGPPAIRLSMAYRRRAVGGPLLCASWLDSTNKCKQPQ